MKLSESLAATDMMEDAAWPCKALLSMSEETMRGIKNNLYKDAGPIQA